jgi:sulfatase maturation enzyme AslB (radical SAM superfamily)
MVFTNLTFIVTDDCNFNCAYCFQKKEKNTITNTTIKQAVDFFYPFFKKDAEIRIGFYGGEPLLAFQQIKHAVMLLLEKNITGDKNIKFSVTTNGSLLTDEMLEFFNHLHFTLLLSFDGLAQDKGRKKGTLDQMVRIMERIQGYPDITFEINSVFTPQTVNDLSESLRFILRHREPEITFNLNSMTGWTAPDLETLNKELKRLADFLVSLYRETGRIPVKNFRLNTPGSGSLGEISCGKCRLAKIERNALKNFRQMLIRQKS